MSELEVKVRTVAGLRVELQEFEVKGRENQWRFSVPALEYTSVVGHETADEAFVKSTMWLSVTLYLMSNKAYAEMRKVTEQ